MTRQLTIIAAPPGSGKTSLPRAWAERSADGRRVAFVSVARDQVDAAEFWSTVLGSIRSPGGQAATAPPDEEHAFGGVRSEIAGQAEQLVLVIDDLHELKSAAALDGLTQLLTDLPGAACLVLFSRRDPGRLGRSPRPRPGPYP